MREKSDRDAGAVDLLVCSVVEQAKFLKAQDGDKMGMKVNIGVVDACFAQTDAAVLHFRYDIVYRLCLGGERPGDGKSSSDI